MTKHAKNQKKINCRIENEPYNNEQEMVRRKKK